MVRLLVAVLLAAVVQFAWGFAFWTKLPLAKEAVQKLPDGDRLAGVLEESIPQTGVYFHPAGDCPMCSDDKEAVEKFLAASRRGPLLQVIYRKEGMEPMSAATMALGFVHLAAGSLLAGMLLLLALPALGSYLSRVLFVFGLGAFAVVAIQFANPVWFHHPWKFTLVQSLYDAVGWLLAGVVMAAVIRPAAARSVAGSARPARAA
jgi:hypothetical protein